MQDAWSGEINAASLARGGRLGEVRGESRKMLVGGESRDGGRMRWVFEQMIAVAKGIGCCDSCCSVVDQDIQKFGPVEERKGVPEWGKDGENCRVG